MGLFTSNRRGPRRFDYEPRYYNPEKDEKMKRRMRIRSRSRNRSTPGLLYLGIMLVLVLLVYNAIG